MSNVFIPQDLVRDVVSRLPVKSLLRFKCVSKSWYLMIDDSEFIKTHAKRSKLIESNMKLITQWFHNGVCKLYVLDLNFREISIVKNMEEINYPSKMNDSGDRVTFAGSCNGLLCLVYSERDAIIVLWNPTTRKHVCLPNCSKHHRTLTFSDICGHGFGYDEVTDDYKVVRMVKYCDENFHEFLVYSLKSNEWRKLEDFAYGVNVNWRLDGVFSNGALHWLLKDGSILAFDLGTEGFQLLPPPETSIMLPLLGVPVFGGYQHLIFFNYFLSPCNCEAWVMKDYETRGSWTKLTSKSSSLMPTTLGNDVIMYDLEKQRLRELKLPVLVKNASACVYFERLVRLDAGGRSDGTASACGDRPGQNKREEERKKKKAKYYV